MGIYVEGLSKHPVDSYKAIERTMEEGNHWLKNLQTCFKSRIKYIPVYFAWVTCTHWCLKFQRLWPKSVWQKCCNKIRSNSYVRAGSFVSLNFDRLDRVLPRIVF